MFSLILMKLGYSVWSKYKLKKIIETRKKVMDKNFKKKRVSSYSKFKRNKALKNKRNKKKRVSLYNKRKNKYKIN